MSKHWNLNDILDPSEYPKHIGEIKSGLSVFKDKLVMGIDPKMVDSTFRDLVASNEKLLEQLEKLYAYPSLKLSVEQDNKEANYQMSLVKNLINEYEDIVRPFNHWIKGLDSQKWKKLDEENARRLFASMPKLEYHFTEMRRLAKRSLSEKEEEIITKKSLNGVSVLNDLRSLFETDQRYKYTDPLSKKVLTINTVAELMKKVYDQNPDVRRNSYKALFAQYKKHQQKYFMIYESVIKDWNDEMKWRHYDFPVSIRNEANDMSDLAVDKLINVCQENQYIFNEFFEYKARLLNMKKLTRYDLYVPVNLAKEKDVAYEKAEKAVMEVFANFDQDFYMHARSIIEGDHIDKFPSKKKHPGAFCAPITPKIKPYILLNYAGQERDMLTMAHELGHAVHFCFSERQTVSTQMAPLTLAETASTFAEMLVFDYLYEREVDTAVKKQMLISKLSETYATINRQIQFVSFEKQAHEAVVNGISLPDFNQLYFHGLRDHFKDSVVVPDVFKYEWTYIPHIVNSPFYCYSYAFGELLAFALYKEYKKKGNGFVRNIKNILEAGGSENPTQLLKNNGIDITKEGFWQEGFATIREWLDELVQIS